MEFVRYSRPAAVATIFDEINDLFNSPYSRIGRSSSGFNPDVDVYEEKEQYLVKAEVPGIDKSDIDVRIENDVLTIAGEKRLPAHESAKDRYAYYERSFGKFSRSFKLPEQVDSNSVEAHYRDGILEVTLKKRPEAAPKSIEIKVA